MGLLREVKGRDGLAVFAWSLRSNHFHLALRTGAVPLSRFGRSTGLERPVLSAAEFVVQGEDFLGVRLEDLAGRGRASDVIRAREMLATLGVERYGQRVKEIAGEVSKSAEAGSRMVRRGRIEKKRRGDARF